MLQLARRLVELRSRMQFQNGKMDLVTVVVESAE